ncbi:MAG TPA: 1,4-alpha-glucan branching protein domain-containing protein, partial [Symbiobacteriaceae bacterium]|nr:1,4-alpha-glucan branching protein domain-containing protein [Symbiobacteriaceae bacterium]
VEWFAADSATVGAAYPAVSGPALLTPGGVAAFARDRDASRWVWDSRAGYPGDPAYREFYKDAGYDLPLDEVAPWLVDGIRGDTGLKLYRVTGDVPLDAKEPYDPAAAQEQAREHARHFAGWMAGRSGLVVAPFDAELFGHWWFEGPLWLEALYRELAAAGVGCTTPSDYLKRQRDGLPVARLPAGSWGDSGDYRVWLSQANDWVWPEVHAAEQRMAELADRAAMSSAALNQAARELLLAEASDWPFILHYRTAAGYARARVRRHLERFGALAAGHGNPAGYRPEDGVFPGLNARVLYRRRPTVPSEGPLRILMLTWEFPPNHVGGLGRHVYDLGGALAAAGHQVQVVTLADPGAPPGAERVAGIQVYRVARPPEDGHFLAWVYRMNQAMVAAAEELCGRPFDVVHSHDWLTGQAGMALKARWGTALAATIHATEKGRNHGIHTRMQQAIHEEEWLLTSTADQVITVSRAMAREVADSFKVNPTVIYNGVSVPAPAPPPARCLDAPYFLYVGRLVQEKGVHVAIQAVGFMHGLAHLVIAGKGPLEEELRRLVRAWGLENRVHFVGRVSELEKASWLQHAAAGLVPSLYEPFGIVALEVMAAGAPVVVGDTGGLAEIVTHGRDGFKVPPGDPGALAVLMDWLLAHPAGARELGASGRTSVEGRFAWPAIAEATVGVYRGPSSQTSVGMPTSSMSGESSAAGGGGSLQSCSSSVMCRVVNAFCRW